MTNITLVATCLFCKFLHCFAFSNHSMNPFPNKPWFLRVCSTSLLKTLWEKEKLLVTSNFSFSHSVFYLFEELSAIFIEFEIVVCKLFQFGRVLNMSFGKGSTLKSRTTTILAFNILSTNSKADRTLKFPNL